MQDHRASLTARIVSLGRAIAVTTGPDGQRRPLDPTAPTLLGDTSGISRSLARWSVRSASAATTLRLATLGFIDQMVDRTNAIDAVLDDARESGVDQVVILGAGLDGRAWRLDSLAGAHVYEIDHPATQATKKARVGELEQRAGELTFVAVNFERESITDGLSGTAFDASKPTAWVWEGVTMYLHPATTDGTLAELADLSAPDSRLAVTYSPPDNIVMRTAAGRFLANRLFERFGEPLIGLTAPEDFQRRVTASGWRVQDDARMAGYAGVERLVVARRPGLV